MCTKPWVPRVFAGAADWEGVGTVPEAGAKAPCSPASFFHGLKAVASTPFDSSPVRLAQGRLCPAAQGMRRASFSVWGCVGELREEGLRGRKVNALPSRAKKSRSIVGTRL